MFASCFSNNILHFYYPNASDNYPAVSSYQEVFLPRLLSSSLFSIC